MARPRSNRPNSGDRRQGDRPGRRDSGGPGPTGRSPRGRFGDAPPRDEDRPARRPFRSRPEGERDERTGSERPRRPFRSRPEGERDERSDRPRRSAPARSASYARGVSSGPARRPVKRTRDEFDAAAEGPQRLQKLLAQAGLGSRRACELLILEGRVTVNGEVVNELGAKFDPLTSKIAVDGQKIQPEKFVYYLVYKPKGYVSTSNDPSGRALVLDLVPKAKERLFIVGRLDRFSEGLMLLTNDGSLTQRLLHPKYGVEKTYRVTVAGDAGQELVRKLTDGIWLAEGKVRARRAKVIDHRGNTSVLEIVLAEGKNREIRRMLARLDHKVLSLLRVAIGPLYIKGLSEGAWRELSDAEVDRLRNYKPGSEEEDSSPARARRSPIERGDRPRRPSGTGRNAGFAGGYGRAERPARPPRDESVSTRRRARPEPEETGEEEIEFTDRMDFGQPQRRPGRTSRPESERAREFESDQPRPRRGGDRPERVEGRPPRARFARNDDQPRESRPRRPRFELKDGDQPRDDRPRRPRFERSEGDQPREDRPRRPRPEGLGGDRPRTGRSGGGPNRGGTRSGEPRRTVLGAQPKSVSSPKRPRKPGGSMKPRNRTRGS